MKDDIKRLKRIFEPESVAVVGVSLSGGKMGNVIYDNLRKSEKDVYAVNPKAEGQEGFYPSVSDIPASLDLVISAVPAKVTVEVVKECVSLDVGGMVLVAGGFREAGEEGERLSREMKKTIEDSDMRVIGPNTLGVYRSWSGLDTFFVGEDIIKRPERGRVSFISQSGFLSLPFLERFCKNGLGLSTFSGLGNRVDVTELDLLDYLGEDDRTEVIAVYLESFVDGRRFYENVREISKKKAIVLLKGGKTQRGKKAVESHTGSLALSSDTIVKGMADQVGVIYAGDEKELIDHSEALAYYGILEGGRVAVVSSAGGMGIIASDNIENEYEHLEVADLSVETEKELSGFLPELASFNNPVDLTPTVDYDDYTNTVEVLLSDDGVDAVVLYLSRTTNFGVEDEENMVRWLGEKSGEKPVFPVVFGEVNGVRLRDMLDERGIVNYDSTKQVLDVMDKLVKRGRFLERVQR